MTNRNRTNPVQFYLSDDEQYILNTKFKASGMKSMSAFLRKLILYGYVYDVDYSYLRNYNTELGRINSNLNQIAKRVNSTGNIYQEDINEVKELMNKVWRTQKSMLSKQSLQPAVFSALLHFLFPSFSFLPFVFQQDYFKYFDYLILNSSIIRLQLPPGPVERVSPPPLSGGDSIS